MMTALAAPAAYAGDSGQHSGRLLHSSPLTNCRSDGKNRNGDKQRRRLNLRDGASTDYNIIGQLPAEIPYGDGEENGWYKVIVPEKGGYDTAVT